MLYSLASLLLYSIVDEVLDDIVWYGPLMVAVFILFSLYICVDYGVEGKLMDIWVCGYDYHTMSNLCLDFHSCCESRLSSVIVMSRSCVGASINEVLRIDDPYPCSICEYVNR